jgi:hypothetical protein
MRPRQLAKQHGHELSPTTEPARVPFGLMLSDEAFELRSGEQLQQLAENTAYSIQGGASSGCLLVLAELHST